MSLLLMIAWFVCTMCIEYMYSVYGGAGLISGPVVSFMIGFQEKEVPWLLVMRRSPVVVVLSSGVGGRAELPTSTVVSPVGA